MTSGVQTASAAGRPSGLRRRFANWLLLEGDRQHVAAGIVLILTGAVWSLVATEIVSVGAGSSVATAFGSGLTSGIVTLLTIALSINQLILARVFGSPNKLMDRLEGSKKIRSQVEELADQPASPNDPAAFLSLLATTLRDRARTAVSATESDTPSEVTASLEDIAAYAESIDAQVQAEMAVSSILRVIIGPEHAFNMAAVKNIRNEHGSDLSTAAQTDLEAVSELLTYIAVVRQFFKTIALQQDFGILSRLLVYSGLVAFLTAVSMTLVYSTGAATLSESTLQVVVPLAFGVVAAPLALFSAFILRAATIASRTVSVGPFIPPSER